MSVLGQALGRCSMTRVFSATTRVASFTSRSRSVSNWTIRHVERFGIKFAASPRHADVLLVTGLVGAVGAVILGTQTRFTTPRSRATLRAGE